MEKRKDASENVITSQLIQERKSAVVYSMEMKLASVLKQLLSEQNISLKDLAIATKVKPSTLSGWKNGVSPRDLVEVHRCAQFFGVTMEKMLFDAPTDMSALNGLLTEKIFDGYLKVNIERVISKKK